MNIFLQSNIPELLHFTPNQSFIDLKDEEIEEIESKKKNE